MRLLSVFILLLSASIVRLMPMERDKADISSLKWPMVGKPMKGRADQQRAILDSLSETKQRCQIAVEKAEEAYEKTYEALMHDPRNETLGRLYEVQRQVIEEENKLLGMVQEDIEETEKRFAALHEGKDETPGTSEQMFDLNQMPK